MLGRDVCECKCWYDPRFHRLDFAITPAGELQCHSVAAQSVAAYKLSQLKSLTARRAAEAGETVQSGTATGRLELALDFEQGQWTGAGYVGQAVKRLYRGAPLPCRHLLRPHRPHERGAVRPMSCRLHVPGRQR